MDEQIMERQPAAKAGSLRLVDPDEIADRMTDMFEAISRRACEIFESNGRIAGRDRENWLTAEAELLHSVPLEVAESKNSLTIRAEVPGFNENELAVSLGERQLIISGAREIEVERKNGQLPIRVMSGDFIYRSIEMPTAVDPKTLKATLTAGILELKMRRAAAVRAARKTFQAA